MPFKPHPTNPDLVIYNPHEYWISKPWVNLTDDEINDIRQRNTINFTEQARLRRH